MVTRKGMGKGKGQGYKNIVHKDKIVHKMSGMGLKQPQINHLANHQWEHKLLNKNKFKDTDGDGKPDIIDCDPLDPNKQDSKIFHVKKGIEIVAHSENTRSGFRHIAVLYVDGDEVERAKVTYQNRTWERYEFESVLKSLLDKTTYLKDKEKNDFIENANKRDREEVSQRFGTIGAVAQMGEVFGKTQKEKNDWKKRMLIAGLPQLDIPDDWDTLSEKEKEKRLNKVIAFAKGE